MAVKVSRFKVTPVMNGAIRRMFFQASKRTCTKPSVQRVPEVKICLS